MGGDGQPSGGGGSGSEATGLRARAVYDYQAGVYNVKCLYCLCVCYVHGNFDLILLFCYSGGG